MKQVSPIRSLTMLLAGCVAATAAAAQNPSPAPDSEVVVEAREREVIERFVQSIVDPGPTDQLPRWDWNKTICSGIIGIDRAQGELVNGRLAAAATLAGLKMGDAGCRPGILTIITTKASVAADAIARRFPVTLGRDGRGRLTQFARSTKPVRWISRTDFDSGDGGPIAGGGPHEPKIVKFSGSRLTKPTRATLSTMLIIVDATKLQGMTLDTLGDYLAVVALTRPQPDGRPHAQSILSYFEDSEIKTLTRYDRSYISALYKASQAGSAKAQASSIRARMRDD